MQITLNNIGKRYNYEWIFRKVNYEFTSDNNYVILGANGSGKSTLLQVITGNLIPSEGDVKYQDTKPVLCHKDELNINSTETSEISNLSQENIYHHLSFASPYLELFEELTLIESIELQAQFKPFYKGLDTKKIIELTQLEKAKNKQLKQYSSGMKQRVRLALAILSDTSLLLLDEPTSNFDKKAIDWYQNLIADYSQNRLIIVCSNQQEYEYPFCNKQLHIEDYH
jgi:ABC-type multidrug transport system ATPase subunit